MRGNSFIHLLHDIKEGLPYVGGVGFIHPRGLDLEHHLLPPVEGVKGAVSGFSLEDVHDMRYAEHIERARSEPHTRGVGGVLREEAPRIEAEARREEVLVSIRAAVRARRLEHPRAALGAAVNASNGLGVDLHRVKGGKGGISSMIARSPTNTTSFSESGVLTYTTGPG
jgi:hypothetical protein